MATILRQNALRLIEKVDDQIGYVVSSRFPNKTLEKKIKSESPTFVTFKQKFGFFSGKQSVSKGHLNLENFVMGIRVRSTSLANFADYNEVRVTVTKAFGQMTYHIIVNVPEKEVHIVELVGSKDVKLVAYFQDAEEAKIYIEKLVSASGLPLKEVTL